MAAVKKECEDFKAELAVSQDKVATLQKELEEAKSANTTLQAELSAATSASGDASKASEASTAELAALRVSAWTQVLYVSLFMYTQAKLDVQQETLKNSADQLAQSDTELKAKAAEVITEAWESGVSGIRMHAQRGREHERLPI